LTSPGVRVNPLEGECAQRVRREQARQFTGPLRRGTARASSAASAAAPSVMRTSRTAVSPRKKCSRCPAPGGRRSSKRRTSWLDAITVGPELKALLEGNAQHVLHIKKRKAADHDERAFAALLRQAIK
jgi:hypothetical protein